MRLRTLGLALVAVFAMSAVAASAASATLPEFGSSSGFPVKFTSHNKTGVEPKLHSTTALGAHNVACKESKDKGEVLNSKEVGKIKVEYKGCVEEGTTKKCTTTGEVAGVIVTKELKGRIGYISEPAKTVGVELEPVTAPLFAEFTCETVGKVKVEGCTIGQAKPVNVPPSTTGELIFKELGGKQEFEEIVGGKNKPCNQKVSAILSGKGWITDEEVEEYATAIELKA